MNVKFIQKMGSDLSVVDSARVSFGKKSRVIRTNDIEVDELRTCWDELSSRDQKLIKYLASHGHWTPFGHASATFYFKAPIFVARQLVKHQVGLVWNEVSRRYVDSDPQFWHPETWRGRPDGSIKQGSGVDLPPEIKVEGEVVDLSYELHHVCVEAEKAYARLLKAGVAPEQARTVLPLATYTEWYWSGSLAAWARVANLRLDEHTQPETREIVCKLDERMRSLFPYSWAALTGAEESE